MDFSTRKNGVRLLLLLAVVIGVAAVVQDLHFDNSLATARSAIRGTDGEATALQVKVAEFRAAQIAYLAAGQDPQYWMRHASALADEIEAGFDRLRGSAVTADAQARILAGHTAFQDMLEADTSARQAVADSQPLLASAAIFTDSFEAQQRLASELAATRTAEHEAAERGLAASARWRVWTSAGALGFVLFFSLIAVRLSQQPPASAAATMAQMLRDLPPPVKAGPAAPAAAASSSVSSATSPPPAPASPATPALPVAVPVAASAPPSRPAPPPPVVNLPEAAELCGDLARVMDERDVPALLARAAKVLEATGVIIWMADSQGRRLEPTLTHGYPDKVLNRLSALDVQADNVTSLAFRSLRSQQVNGTGANSAGAIAVPLITAGGCTGVLAAEVRDGRAAPQETLAMARIIAAQFSAIIAPSTEMDAHAAEA
jgi:hypothetical protein